ncbi:hypothetical protein ACP4OV_007809 [Aristida adscensionis]
MDAVRGIESLAAGDGRHHLFRSLGPTLLISMGYIDLGKWVATVDAGSRFGYDLVLLVLLFNFSAILCQYLSICIGMVTGKNLAEICRQEYSRAICVVLGLQAGLSLLMSEVTMIAGVAVGFNVMFEYDDPITGLCFASVAVNLLPYIVSRLDKRMAGTIYACIAGFALLCFVLGILVSQPKVPVSMNAMFPKLSGESAYSLMALLGANIIAHNFYVHSSVVKVQRNSPVLTLGSLFHDHLFSILFIFSGIFLVNYVLLSSAADEFGNTMLISCQDAIELMKQGTCLLQIFMNPVVPVVLLVILLLSSHIISLTSIISSDVISENFFGVKLSYSAHHLLLKGFSMIPTIYCTKVSSAEGIYQLLLICPVIQAMLLPSSVIPVFRVSSSRLLMGRYMISRYVETMAILSFLLMLFTNIIFAAEILFGDSSWTNNLRRNTGSPVLLPYTVILLLSCACVAFTLSLAATPLKSASIEPETQEVSAHSQMEELSTSDHRQETSTENAAHEEVQRFSVDSFPRDALEGQQRSAFESIDCSGTTIESYPHSQYPTAHTATNPEARPSPYIDREELKAVVVDWTEPVPKVCAATEASTTEKIGAIESDVHADKDTQISLDLECEKSDGGRAPFTSDAPPSSTLNRGKDTEAANVSGNLARPSGLGRAGRRQLVAILDEFWGHLFDYHGKLTQEAKIKGFNYFIGLESRTVNPAVRTDNNLSEASGDPLMRDAMRGLVTTLNPVSHRKDISSPDLAFVPQTGAVAPYTWSRGVHLPNSDIPSSHAESLSNFNAPSYSDSQFYRPATVHGNQLAAYLKGINANQFPPSSIPLDQWRFPKSSGAALPNYANSFTHACKQNVLGSPGASSLRSPTMNHLGTMELGRSYYDPVSLDGSGSGCSSAYPKKYHSSTDISAVIAANRSTLLNEANLGGGAAASQSYLGRLAYLKSKYMDSATRFPSQHAHNEFAQRGLPGQSSMNTNIKSLWTQQPFGQFFSVPSTELTKSEVNTDWKSNSATKDYSPHTEYEAELVHYIRLCITKLLKLEVPGWLFGQNGGCDENLIDQVAEAERVSENETTVDRDASRMRALSKCGDDCVWQASLVISFGVWCIRRVLDLSLMESRPELWGKYTYVLNRLQGILDPAFSRPRKPLNACVCLAKGGPVAEPIRGTFTTAAVILEAIKGVEQAVYSRKGRSGTVAGDVAFPKGKGNLASVLKRYRRRLSGKKTSSGQ